jgi:hypothetical protein
MKLLCIRDCPGELSNPKWGGALFKGRSYDCAPIETINGDILYEVPLDQVGLAGNRPPARYQTEFFAPSGD